MSIVNRLLLLAFALVSFNAQALPTEKLFVKTSRITEETGPVYFIAYLKLEEDETLRAGLQLNPMTESVADVLGGLTEEQTYACDARFTRTGRFVYVYALSNCR